MSKTAKPNNDGPMNLDPDQVKAYLEQNPDFFAQFPDMVTEIQIPHISRGAISLLEKRQEMQRNKITEMEEQLSILIDNARVNEVIFKAISEIYISLVGCPSIAELENVVSKICQDHLYLVQFRLLQPQDEAYLHLQAKLGDKGTYLGRLSNELMEVVFDEEAKSIALIEVVYESEECEEIFGIAAFGAKQADHFQPQMDTFFIKELARLLSKHFVHLVKGDEVSQVEGEAQAE